LLSLSKKVDNKCQERSSWRYWRSNTLRSSRCSWCTNASAEICRLKSTRLTWLPNLWSQDSCQQPINKVRSAFPFKIPVYSRPLMPQNQREPLRLPFMLSLWFLRPQNTGINLICGLFAHSSYLSASFLLLIDWTAAMKIWEGLFVEYHESNLKF
jgi:hypothetical protein